ncbi:uncharacterized protein F4807DRAFT_458348 [Annulohypoxylon truncatum]|uniref:uncharacterized protein n=1 Tax=Annulohypoxylon truncatum TaxID=327061 RepID=UPI002007513F|nr:uncharacterized protein F4807DRAFT_458348 [Annulohypoxylon truncatum]KAI1212145.1 hypothetical protein F4807DRAFT_458348 [Annulohypoxylon truncatum]
MMHSRLFKPSVWLGFPHDGYDVVPFNQYLDIRNLDNSQLDTCVRDAAGLQSLLTFGFLEAAVEKQIPEGTLTRNIASGGRIISTDGLGEIIKDWIQRIRECKGDRKAWFERVHRTLKQANLLLTELVKQKFVIFEPLGENAPSTVCLIAIIGEALVNAKMAFPKEVPREGFSWTMIWIPPYRTLLQEDMIAQGWCPSVVNYLIGTVSVSSLEHAVSCGPTRDDSDHRGCSSQSCARYIVDVKTYTPHHTSPACLSLLGRLQNTCHNVSINLAEVKSLLVAGHVPVVNLNPVEGGSRYRLSADGLGSTTEDGLPICQIRRLSKLIEPGTPFWIDSLCVPGDDTIRKKAISMMAQTYSQAKAVLVLDRTIQLCDSTQYKGKKILRVLTSGWMQRLWTLQEAVLSKVLLLVFSDARIPLRSLIPSISDILLYPYLTDLAGELFRLTKMADHRIYTIGDVARSLRWRTTNRPADETLAIASLLGVQPSILVDLNPEHRMTRLIKELGKIPSNVLFLTGDKIQIPGFRWLPISFMTAHSGSSGGSMLSTGASDALVTPRGLKATYYALIFPKKILEAGKPWELIDSKSGESYQVTDLSSSKDPYECDTFASK